MCVLLGENESTILSILTASSSALKIQSNFLLSIYFFFFFWGGEHKSSGRFSSELSSPCRPFGRLFTRILSAMSDCFLEAGQQPQLSST